MKLNLKDAKNLLLVKNGDIIKKSAFGKGFLKTLKAMIELGALKEEKVTKNSFNISLGRSEAFNGYLEKYLFVDNLTGYIEALSLQNPSRAELSELGVSTKLKSTNPKSGFHINSPDAVEVTINQKRVKLDFPMECALFVHKDAHMAIDDDIIIVGVENFENVSGKLKNRAMFPTGKMIFIERSKALQNLLGNVSNKYIHFGDIDLAGIYIFENEYEPIVHKRGSFFIPENIEMLIKQGHSELYEKQKRKYHFLSGKTDETKALIAMMHKYKRSVEQEIFLRGNEPLPSI